MPSVENAGRFRVWVDHVPQSGVNTGQEVKAYPNGWYLVWDRKIEGGFPEVSWAFGTMSG